MISNYNKTSDKFYRYYKAIEFLDSLSNLPRDEYMTNLKKRKKNASIYLKRMQKLLKDCGNPEKKLKIIHIAGTSGKGSTTLMLHKILTKANRKVGSFVSPYPTVPIEKIIVNDKYIAPKELADLVEEIKPILTKNILQQKTYGAHSYYEVWFALALQHFANKKCEYAIIETGCGGEFDASNVIKKPIITAITSVGKDHEKILGSSIKEIAQAKAGIIKHNTPIVLGTIKKEALIVIEKKAKKEQATIIQPTLNISKSIFSKSSQSITLKENSFKIPFLGSGQKSNALIAIEIAKQLNLKTTTIRQSLKSIKFPLRTEIMQTKPTVILDSAHNIDKIKELLETIKHLTYRKCSIIIGLKSDKNVKKILSLIVPLAHTIYITRFKTPGFTSASLSRMQDVTKEITLGKKKIKVFIDPEEAIVQAIKDAHKDDLIIATGSTYLVGDLRKKWYPEEYILSKRKSF